MVKPAPTLPERARGALLGAAAARSRAGRDPDEQGADARLTLLLAAELLERPVDLRRLMTTWSDSARASPRGIDAATREALSDPNAPHPGESGGAGEARAAVRCLPIALATLGSPRNLVSGTYHVAALLCSGPDGPWPAVALNVTCARLLQGFRDFVPDLIDVLRANAAPAELVDAVRRVPIARRDALPTRAASAGDAVASIEVALWLAYHESKLERAVEWLADVGAVESAAAGMAGGLLGARDGEGAVPADWMTGAPAHAELGRLAERLIGMM